MCKGIYSTHITYFFKKKKKKKKERELQDKREVNLYNLGCSNMLTVKKDDNLLAHNSNWCSKNIL